MSDDTEVSVLHAIRLLTEQTAALREALAAESAARADAERERARIERARIAADRKRTRWYRVTVAAVTLVLLTFGGILLDNQRSLRASEQKWCPILGALISGPPSNTQRGEWIRDVFTQMFTDYGCTPADLSDIPDAPTPSPSPDQT